MLRKRMSREVRKMVEQEIDKDLSRADVREIDTLVADRRKRPQAAART
jgi:protein required for attachment to host cells